MRFDNVINSILKEDLSREERIAALRKVRTSDVRVVILTVPATKGGYPTEETHLVSVELRVNRTIDAVYKDIIAKATGGQDLNNTWDSILKDGWGYWRSDVRFITGDTRSFNAEHFLFAFLIPSSNTEWFSEFNKFEGDEEGGLHYIDNDRHGCPEGWSADLKEAWDEYVMSVLYDYGWLDKFRD